jgi:hypothetical protein
LAANWNREEMKNAKKPLWTRRNPLRAVQGTSRPLPLRGEKMNCAQKKTIASHRGAEILTFPFARKPCQIAMLFYTTSAFKNRKGVF